MVEFALSSVVLMLIIGGLIDIGRAVAVSEVLSSAAREGARYGARFDAPNLAHTFLTDGQIQGVVDAALTASSLPASTLKNPSTTCPAPTDGNAYHNPPYGVSAYPASANEVWLYICYDNTPGIDFTSPPLNQSLQDLNVIVLYSYGPLTPLISAQFGTFHMAANEHITVQGP
jgi:Flp pilus assembly protein TadG